MTYASKPSDLPDIEQLRSMSGRDFMDAVLAGDMPAPPMGQTMNFAVETVEDGRVVFSGVPRFAHLNPMAGVHGGWYGAILDSCMGCAVMTKVPMGSIYTTLEYKVNICRSLAMETTVKAIGTVTHAGRTTCIATGELRDAADDRLYASATTTCLIMALPEA